MFSRTLENKLCNHLYITLSFSEATCDPCDYNLNVCTTNTLCITTTVQVWKPREGVLQATAGSEKTSIYFLCLIPPRYQTADQASKQPDFWGKQTYSKYIHTRMHTKSHYLQLKMPGGGCSVTSRQFSSSLLSPQSFCWLQINEPRYKHLPLAQVNLHSERQKRNQNKNLWGNWCLPSSLLEWLILKVVFFK